MTKVWTDIDKYLYTKRELEPNEKVYKNMMQDIPNHNKYEPKKNKGGKRCGRRNKRTK